MLADYFGIAFRSLAQRRLRTYLTTIGIIIGIAAVVSLIGLGQGLRVAISSQFGMLGTDVLSIRASGVDFAGPPGSGAVNPLERDLVDAVRDVPGVESVVARYIQSTTMRFNDQSAISYAVSIPHGQDRRIFEDMLNLNTQSGRLLKDSDRKGVVLGNDFSEDDQFGKPIKTGDRVILNNQTFEVTGILEKKGSFIFDSAVFVNEETIIDVLGKDEDNINVISVKVEDPDDIEEIEEDINKVLRQERDVEEGEEDFEVETPEQSLESLNSTLFAVQLFITIIAFISLLVGGIGIMNTMYTAVLERRKEIGIMKSIGARNSTIFTLFFIESGFLGLIGGTVGVLLGLAFAYGLAFAGRILLGSDLIQAEAGLVLITGALLFSFIIGTLFGVLPALRASKQKPIESLRSAK